MRILDWMVGVALAASLWSAQAETLVGRVVGVADGDTVTVLEAGKVQHKIRLGGIDAPEKKQAFGQRSKQALSDLVFGRDVRVEYEKRDHYGRIIGKILVGGRAANLAMIEQGMAWWYRAYARDQPPADRPLYEAGEAGARGKRLGLWADKNAIAPWDFRRAQAAERKAARVLAGRD